jgi:long-chain fatty acid transport protein
MVAVADDWTAVYYNPAGLALQRGTQFAIGYGFFSGGVRSGDSLRNLPPGAAVPGRGDFVDPIGDEPASFNRNSNDGTVHSLEAGFRGRAGSAGWGVGFFVSGSGSEWEDTVPAAGGDSIQGSVSFRNGSANLPVSVSIPVVPGLSLGATATLRYGVLDVDYRKGRSGTVPYAMTSTPHTAGFGVGFDVGMLWSPAGWASMGAVARFPYTLSKVGETRTEQSLANFSAESGTAVRERYPFRVSGGAAFRLGERGIVALQATWLDWSAYRRTIHYDSPVPGVFENSEGNPGEWRDAWVYAAGYEQWLSDRWALRCGVAYDQTPDPPPSRTLVGGQVVDVWKFSAGGSARWDRVALHAGYTYTYGPPADGFIPGAEYAASFHELYVEMDWGM